MKYLIILVIIFSKLSLYAVNIDENSSNLSILEESSIFIDKTNKLTKEEILSKKFLTNPSNIVSLGFVTDTSLWTKVILKNTSSKPINKILEYDNSYENSKVEELLFYDGNLTVRRGLLHISKTRASINPIFYLTLKPYESKTYYLKNHSRINITQAKLILWNEIDFIRAESKRQMYIFIFLGIMLTLLIYNFMLFLFTKDKSYFYYVFYILSLMLNSAFYSGMLSLYIPSQTISNFLLKATGSFTIILVLATLLFTQTFLETKKFKKLNTVLNIILWTLPLLAILSYDAWMLNESVHYISLLFGLYIVYVAFYALFKGVKQARFYVFGWSIIMIGFVLQIFQSIFDYDLRTYNLTYLQDLALVLEALLFSIALAHRIKLNNEQLILFKNEEQTRLEIIVSEKTKALTASLNEKEILYKELNHRIKNNLMMIISLLKLQIKRTKNTETTSSLLVTKNRIESISKLYEMLLLNDESLNLNTELYLQGICNNISMGFVKDININYDIQHNLKIDNLIYIGLIVNELITNSFKYAFDEKEEKGEISIVIQNNRDTIIASITDNGKGFKERRKNSLGLSIVKILVEGQLEGSLTINSKEGTNVQIKWKDESL
ncbi:MAG: Sensory transduction histidine kinase [uncultured Sulfurovum sp.]|uniref:histidine kinase n=1 Tax=uncultured Sulfurovum sp. TaxID=269237 RepID=A0A6S6TNA8_9BACT|nr:MAG: Sensory transduction histidine kinase [uncultured Sulfurovum sp.]